MQSLSLVSMRRMESLYHSIPSDVKPFLLRLPEYLVPGRQFVEKPLYG